MNSPNNGFPQHIPGSITIYQGNCLKMRCSPGTPRFKKISMSIERAMIGWWIPIIFRQTPISDSLLNPQGDKYYMIVFILYISSYIPMICPLYPQKPISLLFIPPLMLQSCSIPWSFGPLKGKSSTLGDVASMTAPGPCAKSSRGSMATTWWQGILCSSIPIIPHPQCSNSPKNSPADLQKNLIQHPKKKRSASRIQMQLEDLQVTPSETIVCGWETPVWWETPGSSKSLPIE